MKSEYEELTPLLKLLDDPDPEVVTAVQNRILNIGKEAIPFLDKIWKQTDNPVIFKNIDFLIDQIRTRDLKQDFSNWFSDPDTSLIEGCQLLARIQYPELTVDTVRKLIYPIQNKIWLELNQHLTALEKINIFNHFFYDEFGFRLNTENPDLPGNHFINQVLDTFRGNTFSIAMLYILLAQELGLPVYGIKVSVNILLVYHDILFPSPVKKIPSGAGVLFYINPVRKGTVIGYRDLMFYLTQNKLPNGPEQFRASTYQDLISMQLTRLASDYRFYGNQKRANLVDELRLLQAK
ncbi:MAG: transglutaminase family protein [Bacteroidales bacterium]|nr:transglutaminase family protein [Bacteroidales bacterium]